MLHAPPDADDAPTRAENPTLTPHGEKCLNDCWDIVGCKFHPKMPYLSTKQKEEEVAARTARLAQVKSVLESMWNGVTTCLGVAVSPDLVCELLKRVWLAKGGEHNGKPVFGFVDKGAHAFLTERLPKWQGFKRLERDGVPLGDSNDLEKVKKLWNNVIRCLDVPGGTQSLNAVYKGASRRHAKINEEFI